MSNEEIQKIILAVSKELEINYDISVLLIYTNTHQNIPKEERN